MNVFIGCIFFMTFLVNEFREAQQDKEANVKFRKVEVIAPSITCHGRFQDSLKSKIRDQHDWIRSVQVNNLGKRVLKSRPKFDFGFDSVIVFEIRSEREVRELAKILHRSGLYADTELWHIKSGHKMKDFRNIPFTELIKKQDR